MKVLETAIRHRTYDDMWMMMAKVPDYENAYRFRNEEQKWTTLTPSIWIIVDVKPDKNNLRTKKDAYK